MNRKDFLKNCGGGLCACAGAVTGLAGTTTLSAEPSPAEDWRLRFARRRYAKLIEILSGRMDEKALNEVLFALGTYCSTTDATLQTYRGDFDKYCKHIKQTAAGDDVTYDRERGVITMTSPERTDCFCPLNSVQNQTPKVVCNCSMGWQKHSWETVLQKEVKVELKESILRGDKRCVFEIHVSKKSVS